jgi:radical SAM superfamily enzyme YgiQ (UPF0313 family)
MEQVTDKLRRINIPGMGQVYFNVQKFFLLISEEFRATYGFDRDGKFMNSFLDGVNYKRSLESKIMAKHSGNGEDKTRLFLTDDEARALVDRVLARVQHIRTYVLPDEHPDIAAWMDTILTWDFDRLQAERDAFHAIYKPIGILPPDQYFAVVLQATEGCTWNQCAFCSFYRDRSFRIKSPQEFREHARQVRAFFGRSLGMRHSLFLSDANALVIPQSRLRELLAIAHDEFPIGTPDPTTGSMLDGIYSFLDIFGAEKKSLDDYRELQEYHVRRMYIGLETGDDEIFAFLNKPGSPQECVEVVRTIKTAGLSVGVILLAGAGGDKLYHQHVRNSLKTLCEMSLDSDDIVYLSPLFVSNEDEYSRRMRELGVRDLRLSEMMAQINIIKSSLKSENTPRPRVTLYNIREFVY